MKFGHFMSTPSYPCFTKTRLFKYIENLTTKTYNFQIKKKSAYFCSKHKLLCEAVLTSTHNLRFWAEIKKINVYLCKP